MVRYHIIRDGKIEASTATRELAIDYIREEQRKETEAHQWLHAEFSFIKGEEEFVPYPKKAKGKE